MWNIIFKISYFIKIIIFDLLLWMFIVTVYKILVQQFLNNGWFMVFNTIFSNISVISDGQFYWWRTPEYSEKNTDLSQVTNILIMILVYVFILHSKTLIYTLWWMNSMITQHKSKIVKPICWQIHRLSMAMLLLSIILPLISNSWLDVFWEITCVL
jgi:hypothetical protein